jgi:hypothetical protein
LLFALLPALAMASPADKNAPLVVDENSHLVVMEYEAWFGPKALNFQGFSALPLVQSTDMQAIGGGYDSADPAVIKKHVAWLEYMGVDAAVSEVTNNVSCIFNSGWFVQKYLRNCTQSFRENNRSIRDNTGNLYPAWDGLGTRLKLIPMLGGIDSNVLIKDIDGKTAFEKEIEYFGARLRRYPNLGVIYEGKPLMLIFFWGGAGSRFRRSSSVVPAGAISATPSRTWQEIHFQIDGWISRQPARSLGDTGHAGGTD